MEIISNIDLYELLDIESSVGVKEIKKAYRKKALKCHPDKNPDNPKAAELFHQLSRALEVLTDDAARAAYDKVLNAKKAAALRNRELDSKRKKLKEDLEARERQAQFEFNKKEKSAEEKLKEEIDRLRKEGSKQLEEEIEFVRKQVEREKFSEAEVIDPSLYRLKISWKITEIPSYDSTMLNKIFLKYGDITALVVSSKKKGSALLEFSSPSAAIKAQQLERGFQTNPLTVSWLSGPPPGERGKTDERVPPTTIPSNSESTAGIFPSVPGGNSAPRAFPCFQPAPAPPQSFNKEPHKNEVEDFETLVLLRMRRAEEEKRKKAENETAANTS